MLVKNCRIIRFYVVYCISTPKANYDLLTKICYIANHQLRTLIKMRTSTDLQPNFFAHCPSHTNPLVQQIGHYTLAHLRNIYRKWKHKRPKQILLFLPIFTLIFIFTSVSLVSQCKYLLRLVKGTIL
jgi:hypothetical protein